jgi:DNA-binding transcriptional regulator PaaX
MTTLPPKLTDRQKKIYEFVRYGIALPNGGQVDGEWVVFTTRTRPAKLIAKEFHFSESTARNALSALRTHGLLRTQRRGQDAIYRLKLVESEENGSDSAERDDAADQPQLDERSSKLVANLEATGKVLADATQLVKSVMLGDQQREQVVLSLRRETDALRTERSALEARIAELEQQCADKDERIKWLEELVQNYHEHAQAISKLGQPPSSDDS